MKIWRFVLAFVVILCVCVTSQAEYLKYKDPKQPLNARIRDLIKRMTLQEKIGQMVQIDRSVASAEVMQKYGIGKPTKLASYGGFRVNNSCFDFTQNHMYDSLFIENHTFSLFH